MGQLVPEVLVLEAGEGLLVGLTQLFVRVDATEGSPVLIVGFEGLLAALEVLEDCGVGCIERGEGEVEVVEPELVADVWAFADFEELYLFLEGECRRLHLL